MGLQGGAVGESKWEGEEENNSFPCFGTNRFLNSAELRRNNFIS